MRINIYQRWFRICCHKTTFSCDPHLNLLLHVLYVLWLFHLCNLSNLNHLLFLLLLYLLCSFIVRISFRLLLPHVVILRFTALFLFLFFIRIFFLVFIFVFILVVKPVSALRKSQRSPPLNIVCLKLLRIGGGLLLRGHYWLMPQTLRNCMHVHFHFSCKFLLDVIILKTVRNARNWTLKRQKIVHY